MSQFGDELRRLRRSSGLSQEMLAARAGLSPEAVSLLERGRRSPRMTTMRLLGDALRLRETDRSSLFASVRTAEPTAPVLPVFADAIVGRTADLDNLGRLVERDDSRLITLLGPAGVGKTRIAVAYAERQALRYPDGVHWMPVGALADTTLLPSLAGALGIRSSTDPTVDVIVDHFRSLTALLVIDNAEHQLAASIELCYALLAGAPMIKIIITSRHLTALPGELSFEVRPLGLPVDDTDPAAVMASPAGQLFLARAGFEALDPVDTRATAMICRRLDGLPLALELAAGRTKVLTVRELASTLDSELGILQTPGPAGDQALVDAMVSNSYASLSAREKLIFERLSVFASAFGRDAVASVCSDDLDEIEVVDVLSTLVSKSLVSRRDDGSPSARFRLLHLIRQYAADRFNGRPDSETIRRRHAEYFGQVAEDAAPHLSADDQHEWLTILDRELSNLQRAISWAVEHEPVLALRMVAALGRWCYLRGRYSDGRAWAAAALLAAPGAAITLRAPVLQLAATLAFLQCDYAHASAMVERVHELFVQVDDRAGIVWSKARLGSIARELGEYDRSDALHRSAMALAEQSGDVQVVAAQLNYLCFVTWIRGRCDDALPLGREALKRMRSSGDTEGVIWSLINLGTIARYSGDLDSADVLLNQCLDLCENMSFREGVGWALNQLGAVARLRGNSERALGLQRASLAEHEALGDRWREASSLDELAAIAVENGDPTVAAHHLAAAARLRIEIHAPIPAVERADRDRTEALTRAALGSAYEVTSLTAGLSAPPY